MTPALRGSEASPSARCLPSLAQLRESRSFNPYRCPHGLPMAIPAARAVSLRDTYEAVHRPSGRPQQVHPNATS